MKVLIGSIAVSVLVIGSLIGGVFFGAAFGNPFTWNDASDSSQIVRSLEREEQVVLLSLGVQDIATDSADTKFTSLKIPGTSRQLNLKYAFDAKLGIEGKDVLIEESGGGYTIKIPEFTFIGHENLTYEVLNEENGILSWITPEIEESKILELVLGSDAQRIYIQQHKDVLQEQAAEFYTGIVHGIDPEIQLKFEYTS